MEGYVLCHTEKVWHPVTRVQKEKQDTRGFIQGTHGGVVGERPKRHLDDEARLRRWAKNARNAAGSGRGDRPRGSQKVVFGRLHTQGNRAKRLGS